MIHMMHNSCNTNAGANYADVTLYGHVRAFSEIRIQVMRIWSLNGRYDATSAFMPMAADRMMGLRCSSSMRLERLNQAMGSTIGEPST
jgi:hypothetical protein